MNSPAFIPILAQTSVDASAVMWAGILLIVIVVIGLAGATWLRRWSRRDDDIPLTGFTPDDLRALHRAGKMTDEEYKKASAKVFGAIKAKHLSPETEGEPPAATTEQKLPQSPRLPRPPGPSSPSSPPSA